eukprot:366219-Chlamydomonas_euryale.AAC.1
MPPRSRRVLCVGRTPRRPLLQHQHCPWPSRLQPSARQNKPRQGAGRRGAAATCRIHGVTQRRTTSVGQRSGSAVRARRVSGSVGRGAAETSVECACAGALGVADAEVGGAAR